jgi:hypothetical protein
MKRYLAESVGQSRAGRMWSTIFGKVSGRKAIKSFDKAVDALRKVASSSYI